VPPLCGSPCYPACSSTRWQVQTTMGDPARLVIHGEALAWLAANPAEPGTSVMTSLPDVSEVGLGIEEWRTWFVDAARRVILWVPEGGVAVFYQSDIRHRGAWIDKGYLVTLAAEDLGASMVWHKIVCRRPPGTIAHGRASYSHMLCFSRLSLLSGKPRQSPRHPGPDVFEAGFMPSVRSMGVDACRVACRFLRDETTTRRVVDPFCGIGTALAVANAFGFEAVGVDLSARRCRAARKLTLEAAPARY
jgi:hypothetical protein